MPTSIRNTDILFNDGSTQTAAAPRARVTFDGTNSTIYSGGNSNISSVTKNAIGDYTINFSTAMPNTAYTMATTCNARGSHPVRVASQYAGVDPTTSSIRISTGTSGGSGMTGFFDDCSYVNVAIFL